MVTKHFSKSMSFVATNALNESHLYSCYMQSLMFSANFGFAPEYQKKIVMTK